MKTARTEIHASAVIDPAAELGEGVTVGPYCVIGADVRVGPRTRLLSHVVLEGPLTIGADNVIGPLTSLGSQPQDLKYGGEPTSVEIGDRNRIREHVTINRGTVGGGGVTRVGSDNLLMVHTHIGHDSQVGNDIVMANAATLAGHVIVEDRANVGAYSGVHQFCRVGREAFIGGYSVVTQDALPWVTTVGNRAKSYGVNVVGLKRREYDAERIRRIKDAYRTLFRSKMTQEEALTALAERYGDDADVDYFCSFVRDSERGVCR